METTIKLENRDSVAITHLLKNTELAITTILDWTKSKGYRMNRPIEYDSLVAEKVISSMTLGQKKKLRNAARRTIEHTTLANSSMFFHILHKSGITTERVRVKISEAEEASRKARAEWKASLKLTEELRLKYVEAKKNFQK